MPITGLQIDKALTKFSPYYNFNKHKSSNTEVSFIRILQREKKKVTLDTSHFSGSKSKKYLNHFEKADFT